MNERAADKNRADATLIAELERRIAILETDDGAGFGHFGALDWCACVLGALVLPYLAVLWFWP